MAFSGKKSLPAVFFMLLLIWGDCVTLTIVNELNPGIDLNVHCESEDDDLGKKTISYGGSWQFSFSPNIWGNTLYFCRFSWPGAAPKRFDVYDGNGLYACHNFCYWRVSRRGLCTNPYGYGSYQVDCVPWQ